MARLARVVVPGMPHHVTQRGNRRQETFFAAARYIELNPVRAGLVTAPSEYRWSSARAHLKRKDDCLVRVGPLLALAPSWRRLLNSAATEEQILAFREHERTGRALGDDDFQERLEKKLGRVLRRQKPGPKKATAK